MRKPLFLRTGTTKYVSRFATTRLLILSAVLLGACGNEEFEDLTEFVKNSGTDLRGQVDPAPEIKPYEPFPYDNSGGLPDPFKPRKQEKKDFIGAGQNQPDTARAKQALEEFPLETMKMIGYLSKGQIATAVIRTSEGKLHSVKVGNFVGLNFGKVISITESEVKVKEMVQDSGGDWLERENSLLLVE